MSSIPSLTCVFTFWCRNRLCSKAGCLRLLQPFANVGVDEDEYLRPPDMPQVREVCSSILNKLTLSLSTTISCLLCLNAVNIPHCFIEIHQVASPASWASQPVCCVVKYYCKITQKLLRNNMCSEASFRVARGHCWSMHKDCEVKNWAHNSVRRQSKWQSVL